MPAQIWVLAAVALVVALGFGVVAPAIPLFAREYGVGRTAVGLAISTFAFFRFASALASGAVVDRVGERTVLVGGLALVSVSTFAAAFAPGYAAFVALRGVGGIGSAGFTVAAVSLLLRVAPPAQRGRATSVWQGGFLLGGVAGPAVGGPLTDVDPQLPFFVYSVGLLLAGTVALVGLRRLPDAGPRRPGPDTAGVIVAGPDAPTSAQTPDRAALLTALRHPAYLAALVANIGVGWMLFGVRNSLVPIYVVEDIGRTATWAGAGFLVGSVAQALGLLRAGHVTDLRGRRPAMIVGSAVCTVSIALLVLPPTLWVFLVSMAGFGLGAAFLASAPSAVVGDLSPGRGGKLVAVFQMAADAGAVVGPLLAGWLSDTFSPQVAFGVTAGVLALGLVAALRMPETRGRSPVVVTSGDPA